MEWIFSEHGKGQPIRVLDVFWIGPTMIAGGAYSTRQGHPFVGFTLAGMGIATVIYNGINWFRFREGATQ